MVPYATQYYYTASMADAVIQSSDAELVARMAPCIRRVPGLHSS